jgi:Ca2+-binding EF-hand superfamily protein
MLIFRKTATTVDKSIFEKMLKEADANGDGEIEYIEFKAIMEDFFK